MLSDKTKFNIVWSHGCAGIAHLASHQELLTLKAAGVAYTGLKLEDTGRQWAAVINK